MDGTYIQYAPDKNLPNVLAWRRAVEQADAISDLDTPIGDITDASYLLATYGSGRIVRPEPPKPDLSALQEALF